MKGAIMAKNILTGAVDSLGNTWLNTLVVLVVGTDARDDAKKVKKLKKKIKKLRKCNTP